MAALTAVDWPTAVTVLGLAVLAVAAVRRRGRARRHWRISVTVERDERGVEG